MRKNNKKTRKLPLIGKRRFGFDIQFEKNIYCCLCCSHGSKKILKKLDSEFIFNSYHQWKQYIKDKYAFYDKKDLIEFSRYLNQNIREIKPICEFWNLFIPVILTILLTYSVNEIIRPVFAKTLFSFWSVIIIFLVLMVLIFLPLIIFTWHVYLPLIDNNIEENFFKDYKEIIDELINDLGE